MQVGEQPLVVRAAESLDSERIGQLLPGTIVSVLEERQVRVVRDSSAAPLRACH